MQQQRFERLGVFTYSYEASTPSAALEGHLSEEVKQQRRAHLMEIQQQIMTQQNLAQVGQTRQVLIDRAVPDQQGVWIGRTHGDAPDIDGLVFVTESDEVGLYAGAMVRCEIVAAQQYDLVAVATGDPW